jgi:hypothetical protein
MKTANKINIKYKELFLERRNQISERHKACGNTQCSYNYFDALTFETLCFCGYVKIVFLSLLSS